jgi:predicted esterase
MSMTDTSASSPAPPAAGLAELTNQVSGLIAQGRWPEALTLAEAGRTLAAREPGSYSLWLAGLRCGAGHLVDALRDVREAVDHGYWWHPRLLLEHPQFAPLTAHPDAHEVLERSRVRWQTAQVFAEMAAPVVRRPVGAPKAVLLALHGVTGKARPFTAMWMRAALAAGVALVVPQSPILMNSDGLFGWLPERAHDDVLAAYTAVAAAEGLEDLPVILAGFSQGAGLALDWSLSGTFPSVGFIAVGPALITASSATIAAGAQRGVRGCLMAGEWDWAREHTERFHHQQLVPAGVASRLEIMPAVGHAVSTDFGHRLNAALQFVINT